MTLPNDELDTIIDTVNAIRREHNIRMWQLALDSGISASYLSQILNRRIKPSEYTHNAHRLRQFVKTLRQKYPLTAQTVGK